MMSSFKRLKVGLGFLICLLMSVSSLSIQAAPNFNFVPSATHVKQGDSIRIDLYSTHEIKTCDIKMSKSNFTLFEGKSSHPTRYHYITYVGVSRNLAPKKYNIRFNFTLKDNSSYIKTIPITVDNAQFPVSHVTLNKEKSTLASNKKQLSNEAWIIGKKFKVKSKKKYFEGPFLMPAEGRISSEFGAYRLYNKKDSSRKHAGLDIANAEGSPILAPNHGRVILSTDFKSHGKSIMIDHGWGIVSILTHLDSRHVVEGDIVHKGDRIGSMGMTGIASGSHVHWGIGVQNVRVNPLDWTKSTSLVD